VKKEKAGSWRTDWFEPLPAEKQAAFESIRENLETSYGMLSVALDDAIHMRTRGHLVRARAQAAVSAELMTRVTQRLAELLERMGAAARGARRTGEVGRLAGPLNPEFYRHPGSRHAARRNWILLSFLLPAAWRFRLKVRLLRTTLRKLEETYTERARDLAEGVCTQPGQSWEELDQLHFDLNTTLRECIVLLKYALRTIPAEHLRPLLAEWPASKDACATEKTEARTPAGHPARAT
jgi:hypothetical protein